ncbi:MAG: response regulator [Byssovorax sp.]
MTAEHDPRVAELEAENERLRKLADAKSKVAARALATFQQRALHMEIIRQQNEDLDRLAADLARSKRIEEERARQIEAAAKLQNEFLQNFSHEIRTPLNGIIGYCDLLSRDEGSRLTPYGRRDLNIIKSNARTLLAMINDILDLSKIEAGGVKATREHLDLAPILDECAATARERLKGKEVEMVIHLADDARRIYTDDLKIRQILLNLLTNAAKFTDFGEIVAQASADGGTLVLTVEDTGIGIPADQLSAIFEKFRQVDGTTTRKVGGTGLGLTIVRELVKVLGGTIEVESTLGRGTRFMVRIPDAIEPDSSSERVSAVPQSDRVAPDSRDLARSTILVVDDDAVTRELVRGQLDDAGFTVLLANDGVSALRIVKEQRPAAVLLDIHLPRLDGWGVLAEIKSRPESAATPVVIVSVEEQRDRGFSLGAFDYLVKPVDAERLLTTVRRAIVPGGGEVLIVDDDATTRELVARHLRRVGFTIFEAPSGREALARARISRPGLVVLDLVMPDMSGFDVLRELRRLHADLPVVVLTGKVLDARELAVLKEGFAHVLQKGESAIEAVIEQAHKLLASPKPAEARAPRILYIEDSAQNRDIVRRYLAESYEVIEAEDGEHGVERAKRERPDLILMDLSLPRMDGWEATRILKESSRTAGIPVIALTAHAAREDQARAREVGCADYLTKPVERGQLVAAIARHLAPRPPSPESRGA